MPLPRRPLAFSLRTLMVAVGAGALAAWGWTLYRDRPGALFRAAIALIERENPGAEIHYSDRGDEGWFLTVKPARRISERAADAIGRASLIGGVRFRAGSVDGLIGDLDVSSDAIGELERAFVGVDTGSFEITCRRKPNESDIRRLIEQRKGRP